MTGDKSDLNLKTVIHATDFSVGAQNLQLHFYGTLERFVPQQAKQFCAPGTFVEVRTHTIGFFNTSRTLH
jgi:hypothetical protein